MRTAFLIVGLIFIYSISYTQNLSFEVRGSKNLPVTITQLANAAKMIDINAGFPATWTNDFVSSEIKILVDGEIINAIGLNDELTAEQKKILQKAVVGGEIDVVVGYVHQNSITYSQSIQNIHFILSVVPEVQAEFPGGHQNLSSYMEAHAITKISEELQKNLNTVKVNFKVNEKGEIVDVSIVQSSKISSIDMLLLNAISKMPRWKPAEDAHNVKIKQDFEFILQRSGC